jgi:hypothetical protein
MSAIIGDRGGGKLLVKIGISIIPFYLLILLFYEYFFVPMLKMFAKKKWGAKTILKVGRGGKVMYPLAMAPTMRSTPTPLHKRLLFVDFSKDSRL